MLMRGTSIGDTAEDPCGLDRLGVLVNIPFEIE